ncbi:ricin-type beta-trefoil lectin domain protein [Microbispora sp. KK1-11]|uniref:ricin-type beta-trefoil lectin domain protein n=1 Tax=Microbispora sp. KK1-11 TaxID=2053005 RepID=UPI0021AF8388|nr:ricin-type beta-trefoil lectin domain protein [Microbispora sp. KK1-11]
MRLTVLTGAAVFAVALAFPSVSANAAPSPVPRPDPGTPAATMQQALQRDLRLTPEQARVRQTHEAAAAAVERRVRAELGDRFAGAWYDPAQQRLAAGVLDASDAERVREAGAVPVSVKRSDSQLSAVKAALDRAAGAAGTGVYGWYVDPAANAVVVSAADQAAAEGFVRAASADTAATRISVAQAPRLVYDIRGGDQYVINGNVLCSVGFSVNNGGFVTAGHCGRAGNPTLGYNNVAQGTFVASSFPDNDYAWVRTNGDWTPRPWVNNYGGGSVSVAGSQEAPVGASICRSGRTTGWRCGVVQARNVTVNYSGSLVYGLTQTSACAEGGDSGGAYMSGDQAQGVTSGAAGNCSTGGTTFFQPVNEILGAYGLSLTTTGGDTSALISSLNNKCIDVPNSNFSDGVPLQMYTCNGTNAQKWTFTGGTLRTQNNLCMDVAWGSRDNGAVIQIATCSGNPAQQFVLSAAGDLVNPQSNKCVDIDAWNPNDGARLIQWECHGGANQKWRRG